MLPTSLRTGTTMLSSGWEGFSVKGRSSGKAARKLRQRG
jgi:hypothetical protein